ncbi:MAG: GAF domain-containing protein, partial [Proteobacteria bacterium]|nr:GAF domain-containing protein [Pseudomonadota bacterium]
MTKKEDYFTTICKISRLFGTTKKTKPLLDLVVESAIDTMAGKAACLFLCDENPGHFTIAAQKGLSDNYLHAGSTKVKKVLKLLMSKGYFQIKDACSDPRVDNHDIKKAEGIASLLVVPVKVKNVVIGVLTLYTREIRVFDSDEILFLSALAEQGGIAIEKSRLLDQILRYVRLYHDLTVNINSSLDLKDILDKMACDIAEALDVKATSVKLLDSRGKDLKVVAHFGLSDDYVKTEHSMNDKGIIEALNGQPVVISSVSTEKGVENR